jgi:uncharacterized membrane protein
MQSRTLYSSAEALLAFVGTADTGTLYWAHRTGYDLPCTTGDGCDLAWASHWSHIFGVPIALIGLVAYVFLLFASVLKVTSEPGKFSNILQWFILIPCFFGAVYSWYLQYVDAIYIGPMCVYCRTSAIVMTLLLLISLTERLRKSA